MPENQNDILLPEDLTREVTETEAIVSQYKVLEGAAEIGNTSGAADIPVVQIASAVKLDSHGGSYGFDSSKPFSIKADCNGQKFIVPDLSSVPKPIMESINKQVHAEIMKQGTKLDAGRVIAKALQKYMASTFPDGTVLSNLNTWVNDGHDPYQRPVRLPPPAVLAGQNPNVKKGNAMSQGFFAANPAMSTNAAQHAASLQAAQMAANASFGMGPNGAPLTQMGHTMPQQGFPTFPNQVGNPARPHMVAMPTAPVAPPAPVIPPPAELVVFHLPGANVQSSFHFAKVVEQEYFDETVGSVVVKYLVLARNNLAANAGDRFVPTNPAPGTKVGLTLPDGEQYFLENVTLRFSIKSTDYTILLLRPIVMPQPGDLANAQMNPGELDPAGPTGLGVPAEMTPEDAVAAL